MDYLMVIKQMIADGIISQEVAAKYIKLKEFEDERIRKAIICGMYALKDQGKTCFASIPINNVITWLEKQEHKFIDGTFVNVDDVREDFVQEVYRVLDADSTNDRANQIIDAFDNLPTVTIEKQGEQNPTDKYEPMSLDEAIKHCKEKSCGNNACALEHKQLENWLNELKKLKAQKPVKPKFKVGDFIINDYCFGKVIKLTDDAYLLDTGQGIPFSFEHNIRLWNIQDAKPGDVLVCPKYAGDTIPNIFIFKDIKTKDNDVFCYCSFLETFRTEGYIANADPVNTDFYPATKEQRNLLFSKMKEAGYEWNADKKELNKIEQGPANNQFTPEQASVLTTSIQKRCVWNNCKDHIGGNCLYKKPSAFKPCEYPDCDNYVEDSSEVTSLMDVFQDHEQYKTLECYWNNQKGSCIRNKTVKPCCGYSKCSWWENRPTCYC